MSTNKLKHLKSKLRNSFFFLFQVIKSESNRQRGLVERDVVGRVAEQRDGGAQREVHHQHRELDSLETERCVVAQSLRIHPR